MIRLHHANDVPRRDMTGITVGARGNPVGAPAR